MQPVHLILINRKEEDVKDIRQVLDSLSLYYVLSCCKDRKEIQTILAQKIPPDIMLIDADLPKMDIEFYLREIKNKENKKDVPCFLLATPDKFIFENKAEISGISGVIHKPFSLSGPASTGTLKLVMDLMNRKKQLL